MSCYMYWDKIKTIAGSFKNYGDYEFHEMPLDDIIPLLDSMEEIAHDLTIDFDSAKHMLDDKKMNEALKIIRKFYVVLGTRLETEKAEEILQSDDPWTTMESFHFYDRYKGLIKNENQLVKFTPEHKVVFIGGGPLPLTLILFNQIFESQGVSIEVMPEVVELSLQSDKKTGFEHLK